jgi:hypothetical protein
MPKAINRKHIDISRINSVVLAYVAGFFDGEGTIRIQNHKYNNSYSLHCGIWQVDRTPLDYIALYFGGTVRMRKKQGNANDQWVWQSTSRNALQFLQAIEPFLVVKKAQALVGIQFQQRIIKRRGGRVSEHELAIREAERILMKSLKNTSQDSCNQAIISNQNQEKLL